MAFSPFLGKGAFFPFGFNPSTGGVKKASAENYVPGSATASTELTKINGSIEHILSVALGTRFFLPIFGSKVHELVFEPNDDIFADSIRVYITEALNLWEKRITVFSIDVLTSPADLENNTAKIVINYKMISSQVVGNFIYPFVRQI